jgi:hypothetical protein
VKNLQLIVSLVFVLASLGLVGGLAFAGKVHSEAVLLMITTFGAWLVPSPVKSASPSVDVVKEMAE